MDALTVLARLARRALDEERRALVQIDHAIGIARDLLIEAHEAAGGSAAPPARSPTATSGSCSICAARLAGRRRSQPSSIAWKTSGKRRRRACPSAISSSGAWRS
jgi:hypothetical protein